MPIPDEPLLWPREVAPLVGVTPKVLTSWARQGRLGYVATIGGQRRFPRSEIIRLLRKLNHPDPERLVDEALARRTQRRRRRRGA